MKFEVWEVLGKKVLFTERIDTASLPAGMYSYCIRGCDDDPMEPATLEDWVCVNRIGRCISNTPLKEPTTAYVDIYRKVNYTGEMMTLEEYVSLVA